MGGVPVTVRKRGGKYRLVSRRGKVLGTHRSRAAAKRQESAINISKARKAGHRVPRRK